MFKDCSSLNRAPELPANELHDRTGTSLSSGNGCYDYMFSGCSSLNYIKAMFTTTPSDSYTKGWVDSVAPTGTFVKSAAATWNVTGNNGVPTGWTVKVETPGPGQWRDNPSNYLRFKFVMDGQVRWQNVKGDIQYSKNGGAWTAFNGTIVSMSAGDEIWFKGDLTSGVGASSESSASKFYTSGKFYVSGNAQSLSSFNNTLLGYHFARLFNKCVGLNVDVNTPLVLPATTLANYCYQNMFQGCTSLTTAPALPATTLAGYCYSYMFQGCTSLTTAPELPATTLAGSCYSYMFQNCTSLNYIKALFTTTPSSTYTSNWVSGVASTGIFVKSDAATWNVTGNNGVPNGWTVYTESTEPTPLPGEFSVSSTKKVKFAKGNLQAVIGTGLSDYVATASDWKFAEHQWDYIGNAAGNTSFAVGTTVDFFGWVGASASYDSYGLCTNTDYNNAYYGTGSSEDLKTDWGSIPGVVSSYGSGWGTLTWNEWNYLFTQRTNASSLYGQCQISTANGTVTGMLILPDDWTKPSNCTVTPGDGAFDRVTYSATAASGTSNAWVDMEAAGAVFLPASGKRRGVSVKDVGNCGYYWSSSGLFEDSAFYVEFGSGYLLPKFNDLRYNGYSVRLVRDAD